MVRGTIVALSAPEEVPAGFTSAGTPPAPVITLLDRYLAGLGMPLGLGSHRFEVCHGDALHGNRGELYLATNGAEAPLRR